tara:strand:- start:11877 stop:12083 length:207 start_codon:yes stop_codon:yes gene_type:complete
MGKRKPRLTVKTADSLKMAAIVCEDRILVLSDCYEPDHQSIETLRRASRFLWRLAHWKLDKDLTKEGE